MKKVEWKSKSGKNVTAQVISNTYKVDVEGIGSFTPDGLIDGVFSLGTITMNSKPVALKVPASIEAIDMYMEYLETFEQSLKGEKEYCQHNDKVKSAMAE